MTLSNVSIEPLARGAEANLYPARFLGRDALVKRRHKKAYRHPALDTKLRASRTILEARLLSRAAQAGVPVPLLLHADVPLHELIIAKLNGELLSRALDPLAPALQANAVAQCGTALARLHAAGIYHGDATTSNFMLDSVTQAAGDAKATAKVWLIDFGLAGQSSSAEDFAMDVVLFKKSVSPALFKVFWAAYAKENLKLKAKPDAKRIHATLDEIEQRGRYVVRSQAGG
ncbi:KEOPS complex subunit Bud32 [uncultured archaeon]|nr:KEOPS complex subunit Bud32 [uncultured archaeon]